MKLEKYEYIIENSPSLTLKSDGRVLQNGKDILYGDKCYIEDRNGKIKSVNIAYIVAYKNRMIKGFTNIEDVHIKIKNKKLPVTKDNIEVIVKENIKTSLIRKLQDIGKSYLKNKRLTFSQKEIIYQSKKQVFEFNIEEVCKLTNLKKEIIDEIYKSDYNMHHDNICKTVDSMNENELENICTFYEEGASIEEIQDLFQIKCKNVIESIINGEVWSFNEKQYEEYLKALGVVD